MVFHQPGNSQSHNFDARFYEADIWKPHFHKSLELVHVLGGRLRCYADGQNYCLEAGDWGLCLPYDIHAYEPEAQTRYWVCVFSEDNVHDFLKLTREKAGSFQFRCRPVVADFLSESLIHCPNPSQLLIKAALYAVCDEYLKNVTLIDKNKKMADNIAAITDYMEKNHTKNITLSDISHLLGYDYNYVSRYFHAVFKMSFSEFLSVYRLETAVRLLEQSDKKILDIALESGFQSVRSFNACFRSHFHMSPSAYRKGASAHRG